MRLLILGGTMFLGRELADLAVGKGWDVVIPVSCGRAPSTLPGSSSPCRAVGRTGGRVVGGSGECVGDRHRLDVVVDIAADDPAGAGARHGQAHVAMLSEAPHGQEGRRSKSLTLVEAKSLLRAAEGTPMAAYVVVSLLNGARTEELRALTWSHLDLDGDPPSMQVWRSVRRGGETKTAGPRRTLELPTRCVSTLREHRLVQDSIRSAAGDLWQDLDLVFTTQVGTALDAANVRRSFRAVAEAAGLDPGQWAPRELRHSFVSLLSSSGMRIEDIAHLVGHASTAVTEKVYRKELRPVLRAGATAMNTLFATDGE